MTSFCGVLGAYVTSETVSSQYRDTCSSLLVISLLGLDMNGCSSLVLSVYGPWQGHEDHVT